MDTNAINNEQLTIINQKPESITPEKHEQLADWKGASQLCKKPAGCKPGAIQAKPLFRGYRNS